MLIEIAQLGEDVAYALRLLLRQKTTNFADAQAPTVTIDCAILNGSEKLILKHFIGRIGRLEALLQNSLFGS